MENFKLKIKHFKNQDWSILKTEYNKNKLFEDPLFPAEDKSIFFSQSVPYGIKWKRPKVKS